MTQRGRAPTSTAPKAMARAVVMLLRRMLVFIESSFLALLGDHSKSVWFERASKFCFEAKRTNQR
jgi:hypothetical protein